MIENPVIKFKNKTVKVKAGGDFDPADNIKSVKDPVDGKLEYTTADKPKKGQYTITGDYDLDYPSSYDIKVIAKDLNGNKKTRTYTLKVKKPDNIATSVNNSPPKYQYVLNISTKKFHNPSCGDINRMNESNKQIVTATREEVIKWGYSPCGHCNP